MNHTSSNKNLSSSEATNNAEIYLTSCFEYSRTSQNSFSGIMDEYEKEFLDDCQANKSTQDIENEDILFDLGETLLETGKNVLVEEIDMDIIEIDKESPYSLWESAELKSFFLEFAELSMEEENDVEEEENNLNDQVDDAKQKITFLNITNPQPESLNNDSLHIASQLKNSNTEATMQRRKIFKQTSLMKKIKKQVKEETKNTIKNFGIGIINFIKKEACMVEQILNEIGSTISYSSLMEHLLEVKPHLSRIEHLKKLWIHDVYGKEMRVISELFLRKYACHWIFNSRVENISSPLKYRHRLLEAVRDPNNFESLKWF